MADSGGNLNNNVQTSDFLIPMCNILIRNLLRQNRDLLTWTLKFLENPHETNNFANTMIDPFLPAKMCALNSIKFNNTRYKRFNLVWSSSLSDTVRQEG